MFPHHIRSLSPDCRSSKRHGQAHFLFGQQRITKRLIREFSSIQARRMRWPVEIVGRVSSAVLEDLSAGLSFQSTVSDGAIEFAVPFLLYSITSGGQTTAAQPGFQYCGGSCGCGARASDTGTISNPCAGLAKTPCSNGSSSCVVRDEDGNNVTRNCVWYAAGNPFVALYGISAALAAMSIRRRRCWSAMAEFFGSLR